MFKVFRRDAELLNRKFIDTKQLILVEGVSNEILMILFMVQKALKNTFYLLMPLNIVIPV